MPTDVKADCRGMYRRLYEWHTGEIRRLDAAIPGADAQEQRSMRIVRMRLVAERRRIQKIYPGEFDSDGLDQIGY